MTTPAENVIKICGGFAAVAELTGRDETRVRRWTYPKERGGTGGLIPTDVQIPLLHGARARGIDLRPEHFFPSDVQESPGSDHEGDAA